MRYTSAPQKLLAATTQQRRYRPGARGVSARGPSGLRPAVPGWSLLLLGKAFARAPSLKAATASIIAVGSHETIVPSRLASTLSVKLLSDCDRRRPGRTPPSGGDAGLPPIFPPLLPGGDADATDADAASAICWSCTI